MKKILFDIETDGLLEKVSTVWCLVAKDLETGELRTYGPNLEDEPGLPGVLTGVRLLDKAELLAGHNIIDYDIPALRKLFPWACLNPPVLRDTLILSRLVFPDIKTMDFGLCAKWEMPRQLIGRHSLESWGYRLGLHKIDYTAWCKEQGFDPWAQFRPEMLTYCIGDVEVNHRILMAIIKKRPPRRAVDLEMEYAKVASEMEHNGFPFDVAKAHTLWAKLTGRREELRQAVAALFDDWWVPLGGEKTIPSTRNMKVPGHGSWRLRAKGKTKKADLEALLSDNPPGDNYQWAREHQDQSVEFIPAYELWEEGATYTSVEFREFNPNSRDHIADRLKALYKWRPTEFGKNGQPTLDDEMLSNLPFPPCPLLAEFFMVDKRLGMLSGGRQAWLKCEKETVVHGRLAHRIHGRMNTIGTPTFRCAHSGPNMAQVPSVHNAEGVVPYGYECRDLFIPEKGFVLVGCDASGLQLRGLAHNLQPYDSGDYIRIVTTGDVHKANQETAGLDSRDRAKRFIYAFLFGAGGWKLGFTCGGCTMEEIMETDADTKGLVKAKRHLDFVGLPHTRENVAVTLKGFAMKDRFLKRTPGLADLIQALGDEVKARDGNMVGLDGRLVPLRSAHAALNYKLMSDEAIICKTWKVIFHKEARATGWKNGTDYMQHADVHDEIQFGARPEIAQEIGELAKLCVTKAGEELGYLGPLAGEFKIGASWAGTH